MPNSLRIAPEWIARQPTWMKVSAVLVFGFIMVAAVYLSVQDYQTSRLGYLLLPSQKLDPETTALFVGGLPQAFQIAAAWVMATRQRGRKLALLLFLFAFLPDFGSDVYFKMQGVLWSGDFVADALITLSVLFETFFLFTFGSEFMLMFGWANISPLIAPVLGGAWADLKTMWAAAKSEAAKAAQESGALFGIAPDEAAGKSTASKPSTNGAKKRAAVGGDEDDHEYSGRGVFDGDRR